MLILNQQIMIVVLSAAWAFPHSFMLATFTGKASEYGCACAYRIGGLRRLCNVNSLRPFLVPCKSFQLSILSAVETVEDEGSLGCSLAHSRILCGAGKSVSQCEKTRMPNLPRNNASPLLSIRADLGRLLRWWYLHVGVSLRYLFRSRCECGQAYLCI